MFNIIALKEIDSTNTYGKNNILSLNDGDVIYALKQLNGHGRMSRAWIDSNGSLAFSIIFKNDFVISNFDSLSLISAVSVYLSLRKHIDNVYLKWPNDVIVNDKKICGILMESISYDKIIGLVLGIGVNVNNRIFDDSLNATSLYLESNREFEIKDILNDILTNIETLLNNLKNGDKSYLDIFKKNNYLLNKNVIAMIDNEEKEVKVIDILDDNRLLIKVDDKEIALSTGEITFHKENKK